MRRLTVDRCEEVRRHERSGIAKICGVVKLLLGSSNDKLTKLLILMDGCGDWDWRNSWLGLHGAVLF